MYTCICNHIKKCQFMASFISLSVFYSCVYSICLLESVRKMLAILQHVFIGAVSLAWFVSVVVPGEFGVISKVVYSPCLVNDITWCL